MRRQQPERVGRVVRVEGLQAEAPEQVARRLAHRRLVVDDQHGAQKLLVFVLIGPGHSQSPYRFNKERPGTPHAQVSPIARD